MSTPLATDPGLLPTTNSQPIFQRFLWKEFRMLRGFWLAVGGLAVVVQAVLPHLTFDQSVATDQIFAVAWGAAALYAVGAAITLFSAEREERTRGFLMMLPGPWWPIFLSKVVFAALSAVALAVLLSLAGALIAGGTFPTRVEISRTLAVAGIAIIEAMAWGLLFSLSMKQPLLAAIVSIAAASLGAQIAVAMTSLSGHAFSSSDYGAAVPMRLLICLAVFLVDVWLAIGWLAPARRLRHGWLKRSRPAIGGTANAQTEQAIRSGISQDHPRRWNILARLLWQTWRETWPTMLLAVPIGLLLMLAIFATTWLAGITEIALVICPLLLPALLGALVFRADQRDNHRLFLAIHAGRPHYVWLSRLLVWLTALTLVGLSLQIVGALIAATGLHERMQAYLRNHSYTQPQRMSAWSTAWQLQFGLSVFWSITTVGWSALFAAFGIGQFCSMLLRREVLAGFLALVLAAILTAWALVVGAWELNPAWFVMPLGVAAMAATWVRAPDWMLGRNSLRAWFTPVLTIVVPLGLVFSTLPGARLDQVTRPDLFLLDHYLLRPMRAAVHAQEASRHAARETAAAYQQLHSAIMPWGVAIEGVVVDGKRIDELKFLPDDSSSGASGGAYDGMGGDVADYGSKPFTTEQLQLLERFEPAQQLAYLQANQGVMAELENLSLRPLADIPEPAFLSSNSERLSSYSTFEDLLLDGAAYWTEQDQLITAWQRLATLARIRGQLISRKTSKVVTKINEWHKQRQNLEPAILTWAEHADQSSQGLKRAILELQKIYQNYPPLREAVLADRSLLRDVLLGTEPASFLTDEHRSWTAYLPYLANQLSWERERALRALDILTGLRLRYMDGASNLLENTTSQSESNQTRYNFGELLRQPNWQSDQFVMESSFHADWDGYVATQKYHQLCRTSFLLRDEWSRHVDLPWFLVGAIDAEISRRGLLIQLALIAYRLDHDEYPENLAALAPDYLKHVPMDPYSQSSFEYRPEGLPETLVRDNSINGMLEQVAAETPLFWSVGTSNFVLAQGSDRSFYGGGNDEDDGLQGYDVNFRFRPTSAVWYNVPNLVFTLPVD